jgi:elongation factor 1-beta
MGTALVKLKIMPDSPDANLEEIKEKASSIINPEADSEAKFEEEPVAFGLKAVIAQFAIDESKEIDPIQEKITELSNVNSAEVCDFRRAFG